MTSPKVLKKSTAYKNSRLRILKYKTEFPNKKIKDFFVLDRYSDFSVVVPIFPDMTTVLVGQYRVPVESFSWEYPMGSVRGKTPLETAKQELKEETGISARKYKKMGEFFVAPGFSNQRMHVFIATYLTEGDPKPEPFEFLQTKKVKLSEVKTMIKNGTIKDGPTVLANSFLNNLD